MREYGQIQCAYWQHPDVRRLSREARELGAYLIAGPHSNGIGCYWIHPGYIAADLQVPFETVPDLLAELAEIDLIRRCEDTDFVLLRGFLKWNTISNPNVAAAREKEFVAVPKNFKHRKELAQQLLEHGKHLSEGFQRVLGTIAGTLPSSTPPHPTRSDPTPPHPTTRARARPGDPGGGDDDMPPPDWIPSESWRAWTTHLSEQGRPLRPTTYAAQVRRLAELRDAGDPPEAVIEHSIAGGYLSLHPPAKPRGTNGAGRGYETPFERIRRRNAVGNDDPFAPDAAAEAGDGDGATVDETGRRVRV